MVDLRNSEDKLHLDNIFKMVDGCNYYKDLPNNAKRYAFRHGFILAIMGDEDKMLCFGADCYLTFRCEHKICFYGDDFADTPNNSLRLEAIQLGLKVFRGGKILDPRGSLIRKIPEYSVLRDGSGFSFRVCNHILSQEFAMLKNKSQEILSKGIIIKIPSGFIPSTCISV